eukprot:Skav228354  [mRNA]  locus=scaffold5397:66129:67199:- [translate_table: standard]
MGSGHPQQLGGFGGGTGPTSKIAVVGPHGDPGAVTYNFAQCQVENAQIDKSHGDCGNMLAAVAPFALERGLAKGLDISETCSRLKIHSLNTGSCYEADVSLTCGRHVQYSGDLEIPGAPGKAAPVALASVGVAGAQTGKLLPSASAVDVLDCGFGSAEVTLVDFARALVIVSAADILPKFGYSDLREIDLETVRSDKKLCDALEVLRQQASQLMGMGDCSGKDAPKLALISASPGEIPEIPGGGVLTCRYFVNPERSEMHPTIAMTAAQAIGAACLVQGSVAMKALDKVPKPDETDQCFSFVIQHSQGNFPVSIGTTASSDKLFPLGTPYAGKYRTTVMPIAEGTAFVEPELLKIA